MMNGAILTKRETEIAELLAWGATKKDVANRLFVSERTVENHTRNIYEKTGVTKINELSAWWFCTTFNISFDLSPLKRSAIATFMLFLVAIQITQGQFIVRTSRTSVKTTTTRVRSSRRNADDATTIDFFNF
jgi:DNA-binding CsgD family transcriptional regulator